MSQLHFTLKPKAPEYEMVGTHLALSWDSLPRGAPPRAPPRFPLLPVCGVNVLASFLIERSVDNH